MGKKLVLIHTVTSLVESFRQLCAEIIPEVEVMNIVDEILLKMVLAEGGLSPAIYRRVAQHVEAAEEASADLVMLTCSSVSPCADAARPFVGVPVLKVDEPMVDKAVELGMRIGVVATAPTTLTPTADLVKARAAAAGKDVEVISVLCNDAYDALFAGESETHDRIVREAIEELMTRSDVIVLAQASMARVAETIPGGRQAVPILSSPRLGVERVKEIMEGIR